jgi:hypothetical protein
VKKKFFFIIILVVVIQILSLSNNAQSFEQELYYLETDKDSYKSDEVIKINASWYLDYNSGIETAYIQLQIFNSLNDIIWNSSKYDEPTNITENWIINIVDLNVIISNFSTIIYIKLFCYVKPHMGSEDVFFLDTVQVNITKRIPMCQLIGFKDYIKFGEVLTFNARFYDDISQNNSFLNNQLIKFKAFSNNSLVYQCNFTTDRSGTIEIFILSSHLKMGLNLLLLSLFNNSIYNNSNFFYQVFVEKSPVFIDIIGFDGTLKKNENLELDLFYYYFFNNSLTPLYNLSVKMVIFENETLRYSEIYTTDMAGRINVSLNQELFSSESKSTGLRIDIILNSTLVFDNLSISLNLEISNSDVKSVFNSSILIFLSVSVVISLIMVSVFKKHRVKKNIMLSEIIIKY